jgi:hypothetical protein
MTASLRAGSTAMALTIRAKELDVAHNGILVAKQISGGTECVLGVKRDVEMGPVVMFGLGGLLVELFRDVSFAPPTLDAEAARDGARRARTCCWRASAAPKPGDVDGALRCARQSRAARTRAGDHRGESISIRSRCSNAAAEVLRSTPVVLRPPVDAAPHVARRSRSAP